MNGLVDDAVTDGQNRLVGERSLDVSEEILGPTLHLFKAFDVVGPCNIVQIGNESAREVAPIALAQERCRLHVFMMWGCNDAASVDRTLQIARYKGVDLLAFQLVARGFGLLDARFVELALLLSLQDLGGVVHGFAVAYQI